MASLYRLAARASLDVTSRGIPPASFSHSAILSSAALSAGSFETRSAPQIFDIFDAPVRLRERNNTDEPLKAPYSLSTTRVTSRAGPSHSKSIYNDALGLPWSLPPPVTFDGPACPPHMSPSILKKRRLQRQNLTHSSRGIHGSSIVSCSAFTPTSQPLYQLFDGPSRITRCQYPTSHNEVCSGPPIGSSRADHLDYQRYSFTYVSLALCLSSAFGWLVLKDNLDLQQKRSPR